ncbi:MAG: hypothetical protein ACRDKV_00645 [Solirubrobacterales bacterium]
MGPPRERQLLTVANAPYLPNVIALHDSLRRVSRDRFGMQVVCTDAQAGELLQALALPGLTVIPLGDIEQFDPGLPDVRDQRTSEEYSWTLKAPGLRYAFEREPELDMLSFVDADMLFFDDPAPMFDELGDASILLVAHNFHPRWDKVEKVGPYNSGSIVFRRDSNALAALSYWRDRTNEWCFNQHVDGLFGDQRFLDDWPERFEGVRVTRNPGINLTCASSPNFELEWRDDRPLVDGRPVILYHYTSHEIYGGVTRLRRLGLFRDEFELVRQPVPLVWGRPWRVERPEELRLWQSYMERLSEAIAVIREVDRHFSAPFEGSRRDGRRHLAQRKLKRARRRVRAARQVAGRAVQSVGVRR